MKKNTKILAALCLFPVLLNAQSLTHNFDNIGIFNPAAVAQRDYHSFSMLGRTNIDHFFKSNQLLINGELELMDSASAIGFSTNMNRSLFSGTLTSIQMLDLTFRAGYRYRYDASDQLSLSSGVSLENNRFTRDVEEVNPNGALVDFKANSWSINGGFLVEFYGINLGLAINNINQATVKYRDADSIFFESKTLRSYHIHLAYDYKTQKSFKARPQLYWGVNQHYGFNDQILRNNALFASVEMTHANKFYWSPGYRIVLFESNENPIAALSMSTGAIIKNRMQIGLSGEIFFSEFSRYYSAEIFLKYRIRR